MRPSGAQPPSELRQALSPCLGAVAAVILFTICINILLLASPIYMLQVYDRVLRSRSESTLVLLTLITIGLLLVMAGLDLLRSRIMMRVGARLEGVLGGRVFAAICERQLQMPGAQRTQPLNDLSTLRQFVSGSGLFVLFDLPWTPIFLVFLYFVHPLLGLTALLGVVVIFGLTLASEMLNRHRLAQAGAEHIAGLSFTETSLRNAEVLGAMGMLPAVRRRWLERHARATVLQMQAGDLAGGLTAASKFVRVMLQTTMLGAGALLAIEGMISPGMMIAASIVGGKALAPVEMAVANWSSFVNARLAYGRLDALFRAVPSRPEGMELPQPKGRLTFEGVFAVPPGGSTPVIKGVSFAVEPGEVVGIIGPSAAGKSTLAKLMTGVWLPSAGKVRIDGVDVQTWPRERLGPYIGYLPQDIEMLEGTAAENIARFGEVDGIKVVEAARLAGVHDMILHLPAGYDTSVGETGAGLSGGQKQRLALARALYGSPALYIFDEPNSNLDEEGEASLVEAIRLLREGGRTVLVIAHRPSVLAHADKVLVLRDGVMAAFGPRAEVLARFTRPMVASKTVTA
jgi:PrtD family type I secretion system ABC transporter